jgi:hypothetical protein
MYLEALFTFKTLEKNIGKTDDFYVNLFKDIFTPLSFTCAIKYLLDSKTHQYKFRAEFAQKKAIEEISNSLILYKFSIAHAMDYDVQLMERRPIKRYDDTTIERFVSHG